MKNKKKFLWGLIILIVIAFLSVGIFFIVKNKTHNNNNKREEKIEAKENDKKELATPLLYKVTKDGSDNVIYLFGSIHVADDRAYPMRDEITTAYEESDYLAVEFDVVSYMKDISKQTEDLALLVYTNGDTIKDHLSEDAYNKIVDYLTENKVYNKLYDMYKPALFYSLVTQVASEKSGLDTNKGIDMYFLKKAHEDEKNILEIETSSYQYGLLASFSDKFYEAIILSMIVAEKVSINEIKELYESWLLGDASKIEENAQSEEIDLPDIEGYNDIISEAKNFNKKLVDDRNKEMINKIDGYFKDNKKTFVVVGTAHITGKKGIASGLKEKGYNVSIVEYK